MSATHRQLLAAARRVAKAHDRLAGAIAKVKGHRGDPVTAWRAVDLARVVVARADAALVVAALAYGDGAR